MAICESALSLVIVGHVDHGKSTLVGRLLADTGSLPESRIEGVRALCARSSKEFEHAFLLDTLRDERAQGITIDATRAFFRTPTRRYMVLDAPGHVEFLKNMVTGAAKADAAILVIDAKEGLRENSRRHFVLLSLLGIRQVAVVINKMDLVEFSKEAFLEIRSECSRFLGQLGLRPCEFIPASASMGENLVKSSSKMAWHSGRTLLETIESFASQEPAHLAPFRMPVQDVYKFTRDGDERRIIAGSVESGALGIGDEVVFWPSGKRSRVSSFEAFHAPKPNAARAGQACGFQLTDEVYVKRGEIAGKIGEPPPRIGAQFAASIFWLTPNPLRQDRTYVLKLGTARTRARCINIANIIDTQTLSNSVKRKVEQNDVADCAFELDDPLAFECKESSLALSRFVLFDGAQPCGGGAIRDASAAKQIF